MKYVFHNKFTMIFHDKEKTISLNFKIKRFHVLELLFNKVAGLYSWNFIKKNCNTDVFLESCEIFKNTYLQKHLRTAASMLLIIKLRNKYWAAADLLIFINYRDNCNWKKIVTLSIYIMSKTHAITDFPLLATQWYIKYLTEKIYNKYNNVM